MKKTLTVLGIVLLIAAFAYPVSGRIIRPYKKGSNDGIGIAANAGTGVPGTFIIDGEREKGKPVTLDHVGIFADGVAVRRVGDETFRLCQEYVDEIITVDTDQICNPWRMIKFFIERRPMLQAMGMPMPPWVSGVGSAPAFLHQY